MDKKVKDLSKKELDIILYGSGKEKVHFHYVNDFGRARSSDIQFEGVVNNIARRYRETSSDFTRDHLENYMAVKDCPGCDGYRLSEEALAVKVNGKHISEVTEFSITDAGEFFKTLTLTTKEVQI